MKKNKFDKELKLAVKAYRKSKTKANGRHLGDLLGLMYDRILEVYKVDDIDRRICILKAFDGLTEYDYTQKPMNYFMSILFEAMAESHQRSRIEKKYAKFV